MQQKRRYFRGTPEERFHHYANKEAENGHWIWTGTTRVNKRGNGKEFVYGVMSINAYPVRAHRFSYELFVGPIHEGLLIDHVCRETLCVNPEHLEAVTNKENTDRGECVQINRARQLAKTHCKNNHPLSGDNLGKSKTQRVCLRCKANREAERRNRLS